MGKFELGDEVRLVKGTPLWAQHQDLNNSTGLVVGLADDGATIERITVSYDGTVKFQGVDARQFEPEQVIEWREPTGDNLWRGMVGEVEVAHVWARVNGAREVLDWWWRLTKAGQENSVLSGGATSVDVEHAKDDALRAYRAGPRVGNG